jgi:hypothetical protein
MLSIRVFKYGEVSVYKQRTASVRESGSNFMFDTVPLAKGEYGYETQQIKAPVQECTHVEIMGKSYDKGAVYDYPFIFSFKENPELGEWIKSILFEDNIIYQDTLMGMSEETIPLIVKEIAKGCAVILESREKYAHPYQLRVEEFVSWANAFNVEPLIAQTD